MADAGGGNWNRGGTTGGTDREVLAAPAAGAPAWTRGAAAGPLPVASSPTGLTIERRYTEPGVHPFDCVEWDIRDAVIANEKGESVFEQFGVEVPKAWSQTATNVVTSKYFRGQLGTSGRESSVRQLISRVADRIAAWGREGGYFSSEADAESFHAELTHILLHQYACFNSPVWFNVGIEERPQCSACFINSVEDTMQSILGLAKTEGMLFKFGSGTGSNLSALRSSAETLAGGGTASGPVSFMRGFDAFAGVIKSGGKTRRAAKMVILDADHPDIVAIHPLQGGRGAQGLGADRGRLRRGLQRPRRRLRLDLLPEREPLGARHRRVHAGGGGRRGMDDDRGHRRPAHEQPPGGANCCN